MATVVRRTHNSVTLYRHCLSCLFAYAYFANLVCLLGFRQPQSVNLLQYIPYKNFFEVMRFLLFMWLSLQMNSSVFFINMGANVDSADFNCMRTSEMEIIDIKKGKIHPRTGHEGPEGEQRYRCTPSLTSALDGLVGHRRTPAALTPRKTRYLLYRLLGGPQGWSGQIRKISPPTRFAPRTAQPVGSRYTDWANPAIIWYCIVK